jgi:hypothetical protein
MNGLQAIENTNVIRRIVFLAQAMVIVLGTSLASGSESRMPLLYIANQGQAPGEARFLARVPGMSMQFLDREVKIVTEFSELSIEFAGSSSNASLEPLEELGGPVNYLIGPDPARWITGVPAYRGVRYREIYPGIEARFSSSGRLLKSDFVAAPDADVGGIRLRYRGARAEIDRDGSLLLFTGSGQLREAAPAVYQVSADG